MRHRIVPSTAVRQSGHVTPPEACQLLRQALQYECPHAVPTVVAVSSRSKHIGQLMAAAVFLDGRARRRFRVFS